MSEEREKDDGFHSPTASDEEGEEEESSSSSSQPTYPPGTVVTAAQAQEMISGSEVRSLADIRGEWELRKVSLFGAVKSFIGQLKVGQDMTRVSLPCVFLRPYSLLEEVASRNFAHIDILFDIPKKKDPRERILGVIQWLITTAKQEHYNHKPFNPVAGEINRCHFQHDPQDKEDTTYFLVEQVRHHPPTCGIRIDNPKRKLAVQGHYTFQVQFNRNSVTVANNGKVNIRIGDENYFMPKAMPDINIKNVIIGSKLVVWEGKMTLECKETNLIADCELYCKDRTNLVKGKLINTKEEPETALAFIEGKCGGHTVWWNNVKHPQFKAQLKDAGKKEKEVKKEIEEKHVLVEDPPEAGRSSITPKYPKSQEPNSSITVWKPVAKYILENNMDQGDIEKVVIEEKQRATLNPLKDKGEEFVPLWFEQDETTPGSWKIKDPKWYKRYTY